MFATKEIEQLQMIVLYIFGYRRVTWAFFVSKILQLFYPDLMVMKF